MQYNKRRVSFLDVCEAINWKEGWFSSGHLKVMIVEGVYCPAKSWQMEKLEDWGPKFLWEENQKKYKSKMR